MLSDTELQSVWLSRAVGSEWCSMQLGEIMKNDVFEKWAALAWALPEEPSRVPVPLHVLLSEAVQVAHFFNAYYDSQLDPAGRVMRPGLEHAVHGGQFHKELANEILELQEATQVAQTRYSLMLLTDGPPFARAEFVLGELVAGLTFLLHDGVTDDHDERLVRLAQAHPSPTSQDALAAALNDYAALGDLHREALSKMGAFEIGWLDEARTLAVELREASARKIAGHARQERQRALTLRNRLSAMLYERMQRVRSAARYVFRHDPGVVRQVTSRYQRERVARYRKRRAGGLASEPEPTDME